MTIEPSISAVVREQLHYFGLGNFEVTLTENTDGHIVCELKRTVVFTSPDKLGGRYSEIGELTDDILNSNFAKSSEREINELQKYRDYFDLTIRMEAAKVGSNDQK
jgi:hypothetical protein